MDAILISLIVARRVNFTCSCSLSKPLGWDLGAARPSFFFHYMPFRGLSSLVFFVVVDLLVFRLPSRKDT